MTTWIINYDNTNKEIEKRILCQPQTFKLSSKENKTTIKTMTDQGHVRMVEVLAEVIMERVFREVAYKHMVEMGYTQTFINSYLTRDLINEIFKTPWFDQLEDRIEKELEEIEKAQTGQHEFDLDAFSRFQTHQLRKDIDGFMRLGDNEVKEQLIRTALAPMSKMLKESLPEEELEDDETVEALTVELIREDGDITILTNDGDYLASGMEESFAEVMKQSAYEEDSDLNQSYKEGVLFSFMALIFPIKNYVINKEEVELKETLEAAFEHLGISTEVDSL